MRGVLSAIAATGAGRWFPAAAGRAIIFTLHHVRPDRGQVFDPNAHLSVTPDFLSEAIVAATECGLHPVHLEDLPGLLAQPADERRFVCFTLDDGYRDNAAFAAPVFRRHGVPYTIFVTPGFVTRSRTMWWETAEALVRAVPQLRFDFGRGEEALGCTDVADKMAAFERLVAFVQAADEDMAVARIDGAAAAQAGIDAMAIVNDEIMTADELRVLSEGDPLVRLGAHTMTHPALARVSEDRLRHELIHSAAQIAVYCDRVPLALAYPYGSPAAVGEREQRVAAELGFSVAVTTQPGVLTTDSLRRPTAWPRVSLNGHFQKARYVRALASGLPFRLRG